MFQTKVIPKANKKHSSCKLCLENKRLIKAHIIPDFLYHDLYDDKHMISVASVREIMVGKHKIHNKFSGEYDSDILCQQCDNKILGKYESYAKNYFYTCLINRIDNSKIEDYESIIINIEYERFKLFLLSMLWRASISKRPLFRHIHLGPHEEIIRKMLLFGDPKEGNDYPVILWSYLNDKLFPQDLIVEPAAIKRNSGRIYIFIISGIIYVYHISQSTINNFVRCNTINKNNEIPIYLVPKGQMKEVLKKYYGINK